MGLLVYEDVIEKPIREGILGWAFCGTRGGVPLRPYEFRMTHPIAGGLAAHVDSDQLAGKG